MADSRKLPEFNISQFKQLETDKSRFNRPTPLKMPKNRYHKHMDRGNSVDHA